MGLTCGAPTRFPVRPHPLAAGKPTRPPHKPAGSGVSACAWHSPDPESRECLGDDPMIGEEVTAPASEADQLREQLLRAQRLSSVGTLASSVAHEFNNILTTIMNYAKLGLRAETTEAGRLQALEKIL